MRSPATESTLSPVCRRRATSAGAHSRTLPAFASIEPVIDTAGRYEPERAGVEPDVDPVDLGDVTEVDRRLPGVELDVDDAEPGADEVGDDRAGVRRPAGRRGARPSAGVTCHRSRSPRKVPKSPSGGETSSALAFVPRCVGPIPASSTPSTIQFCPSVVAISTVPQSTSTATDGVRRERPGAWRERRAASTRIRTRPTEGRRSRRTRPSGSPPPAGRASPTRSARRSSRAASG